MLAVTSATDATAARRLAARLPSPGSESVVVRLYEDWRKCLPDGARQLGATTSLRLPRLFVHAQLPLEHQLRHPRVRPLDLLGQLQAVVQDSGWVCRLSEKGQYAEGAKDLLGGFDALCAGLRDEDIAKVLMTYLDGSGDAAGLALRGERRRYLSLSDIETAIGSNLRVPALVRRLEGRRALVRGLVLKCERCRHAAWFYDVAGRTSELDFVVVEEGLLWLGEAFSGERYGSGRETLRRLHRLAEIASLLNARGVILATAADAPSLSSTRRR